MLRPQTSSLALLVALGLVACGPQAPESETPEPKESHWQEDKQVAAPGTRTEPSTPPFEPGTSTTPAPASIGPAPASSGPAPASSRLPPKQQAILDRHNQHRADHCAPPLRWSPKLAAVAQTWADRLKEAGCAFEHSRQSPYGENLSFFAPVGSSSPDEVATGWYNEVSAYDFTRGTFGMDTGHFTQVVWRGSQSLGCGQSQCNGGELWVCNYDPPGNMSGAFRENVLPKGCAGE